ncbi:hypothetical protein NQZ68_035209 [Dissostichus eleginoides]|nr:hypothetical protein NQZ68_035209 [Dissostichus eleginoides]
MVWIWVEEKVSNGSPSAFMAVKNELDRAKPPVSREKGRGYGQHETQQLLRPSLLRPEELSMESGIDPGQEYYAQDYYNYDHGYELPQYGSRRKLIPPSGLYDEYGEVVVDDDGSYYYSPQESEGEPRPPTSHGSPRKTPIAPGAEGDKHQPSEGGTHTNEKPKSSSAAARLKALMKVGNLLSSGSKTSGQPPAIHPPWNKARVRPVEDGEGCRNEERNGERVGTGFERGGGRDAATERGRERGGMETCGRSNRGGVTNNGMINAEGVRPENRPELPGHFSSMDGSMVINGSYFQSFGEARKPPPVKQKLSEALSLISLTRRLQGPARVGDEQWSDVKSWERGERKSRKMNGSIGNMSVSASVSERAMGEERRRWEGEVGELNRCSEVWWEREKRFHDCESETGSGSKESPSEYSPSDASSPTSSVTAEHSKNESDAETEKEEGTDRESESGSQQGGGWESGLESEDERKELSRKRSKGSSSTSTRSSVGGKRRRRSANLKSKSRQRERSSSDSRRSRYSGSSASSSRPKTSRHSRSSHDTIEEESEEDEESAEEEDKGGKSAGSRKSSTSRHNVQSDISSGLMDTSEDLSPIIEDTEEEEKSSGHGEGGDEEEEKGDSENEPTD